MKTFFMPPKSNILHAFAPQMIVGAWKILPPTKTLTRNFNYSTNRYCPSRMFPLCIYLQFVEQFIKILFYFSPCLAWNCWGLEWYGENMAGISLELLHMSKEKRGHSNIVMQGGGGVFWFLWQNVTRGRWVVLAVQCHIFYI